MEGAAESLRLQVVGAVGEDLVRLGAGQKAVPVGPAPRPSVVAEPLDGRLHCGLAAAVGEL